MLYFQERKIEADSNSDGGENHTCQELFILSRSSEIYFLYLCFCYIEVKYLC